VPFGKRHAMAVQPFSQMLLIELFSAFSYSQPKCVILGDETEVLRFSSRRSVNPPLYVIFNGFDN
jgi:hypothetical protein